MSQNIALITGISGQDASFLAELLLEKNYIVYGLSRRTSTPNLERVNHLLENDNFHILHGDILDLSSIINAIETAQPTEFYHLAAQSFVGESWNQPIFTSECTGIGTLNCLEAIRLTNKNIRFYNAASSEMFGKVQEVPQTELTPFYPRSPYGVAKCFGYWMTKNYRESYDIFACSGILFNHECFEANTPIIVKKQGYIDIDYIRNFLPERKDLSKEYNIISREVKDTEIWNGEKFVELKAITRNKLKNLKEESNRIKIQNNTRWGSVAITPNHKMILENGEKEPCYNIKKDTIIKHGNFPKSVPSISITLEEAELLGLLTGDGHISNKSIRLINKDSEICSRFIYLCEKNFGPIKYRDNKYNGGYGESRNIDISGVCSDKVNSIRKEIYDKRTKHKKVPLRILNSSKEIMLAFLRGYYLADGLKQDKCTYEFKSFKSNSPLLCQGLLYLLSNTVDQDYCINSFVQNNKMYHQINLNSPEDNNKGLHFKKERTTIKKQIEYDKNIDCFVYDIETECGYLNAGIGTMVVGNSERRGLEFVTRKISNEVAKISHGLSNNISLGNLDSKRDWGYAKDYVEAMYLMLQQESPDDFVIATNKTHSIRDFLDCAFREIQIEDWESYVKIDPKFIRPAEVDLLIGDYSKAREKLGWEPKTSFEELVRIMVNADYQRYLKD